MNNTEFKLARKSKKFTQVQLAKLFGVRQGTISDWETGRRAVPKWVPLALKGIKK